MTSLPLNRSNNDNRTKSVPEWGTNRIKEKVPLWSAKSPTWHLSGEPIKQSYELTQLKKSNVRMNDQLLPKPQESRMSEDMIHLPFPADHPYASHIPQKKLFPSFATTAEEPKRGIAALHTLPLSSETPAAAFDVQILNKTKGTPDRHEIQSLPQTSLRRGLTWHGDDGFHQQVKIYGDRQAYYPIPPSTLVPNLQPRAGTAHEISDRTANATRNLERQQWKTSYENNYTGNGPANQYKLDNLDEKISTKILTGVEDDNLYPWFTNSFEPSRPQEGRLALVVNPNYGVPQSKGAMQEDTGYVRKPTLSEREEHRLLYGTNYVNLPNSSQETNDNQWKEWMDMNNPEERFAALIQKQMRNAPDPTPFVERGTAPLSETRHATYMDELRKEHHDNIQQIEAGNRWKQLELVEQVPVFYGHEGKYNEERAGLYKTSYDPSKLAYKLDSDPGKLNQRVTYASAIDAINYPTELNLVADSMRADIETDPTKVPMFSERPDINEVFDPFKRDRQVRLAQLSPDISNARPRIQEREVINTQSTLGSGFNEQKFLQEYALSKNARSEPLALMSAQNQNLANVKINARKHVKFDDQITVGEGAGNRPLVVSKASIDAPKVALFSPKTAPPRTIRNVPGNLLTQSLPDTSSNDFSAMKMSTRPFTSGFASNENGGNKSESIFASNPRKTPKMSLDLFESKSSNLGIGGTSQSLYKSSYDQQFQPFSVAKREDRRYSWEPGCGVPRPQTSLIKIQNAFSKSQVHKNLRENFPERNPHLIDNIHNGRKHEFGMFNAQVLRGTLVNA